MSTPISLYPAIEAVLMCDDVAAKPQQALALYASWQAGACVRNGGALYRVPAPGRPAKPPLVAPGKVPRRGLGTPAGQAALLHAIAHIEFNAINLALDAAWRFRDMPDAFVEDWLRIAAEEAMHFGLLQQRLAALGHTYGDFPAHNALWEMAVDTDHDVLTRMALVPRVMEARGLDATPPIQRKLAQIGDHDSVAVLDIILRDEIGHVRVGNYWFTTLCDARGLDPLPTFRRLLADYRVGLLRGEINLDARLAAGFSQFELDMLEDFAVTRQHPGERTPDAKTV
ncbi:ferritin-like domain-containing protein [Vogesella urethralis]|uniref:ferritin-like domain-containing protein n=1 Tax=Vogesella urethralis TaxID=2592656 RepID=UPI001186E0DA|nr:ferritin-like domain-containing protein [Vogesella urethralis]